MKSIFRIIPVVAIIALLAGCAVVDVTKTAQGYFPPTNPNTIMILKTIPPKKYVELGTVTVTRFRPTDTAQMHNAIRTKSAPLGADAVVLTEEGILPDGTKWATGVAIRFQ